MSVWKTTFLAAVLTVGCHGGPAHEEPANGEPGAAGGGVQATDVAAPDAEPAADRPAPAAEGSVAFAVDGRGRDFDFVVADETYYGKISSAVVARPSEGATEQLRITFMSLDLRGVELPGELPPANAGTTLANAMQNVGFSYVGEDGEEWAGPGKIHVESFDESGKLVAHFSEISLPHTDGERPAIVLSDGSVAAVLD